MIFNRATKFALTLLFVVALLSAGCKPKNPDGREDVSGKITLNGKNIPEYTGVCSIQFDPQGDDKRAGGNGPIFDGEYLLTGNDGVKPGKYTVRILYSVSYDGATGQPATVESGDLNQYLVNYLPPEFNSESQIEFEVVAKKKNVFDYDIVTDFQPQVDAPRSNKKGGFVDP